MTKANNTMIDLSVFDEAAKKHEAGIDVKIVGPDGKTPIGLTIRMAGPDSERAQRAQEALAEEMIEQGNLGQASFDDVSIRQIRYLAHLTISWTPAVVIDGQELNCSIENAEKLYTRYPNIRRQADKAAGNHKAFMKG